MLLFLCALFYHAIGVAFVAAVCMTSDHCAMKSVLSNSARYMITKPQTDLVSNAKMCSSPTVNSLITGREEHHQY